MVALGTNDAANVAVGSGYGYSERIDRMMEIIGDDPVLWVDVKTLTDRAGPYASEQHAAVQHGARQGPRPVPGDARCSTGPMSSPTSGSSPTASTTRMTAPPTGAALDRRRRRRGVPRRRADAQIPPAWRIVSIISRMPSDVRCIAS